MKSSRKRKVTAAFFAAAALGGVAHAAPTLNMNDLVGSNTTTESTAQATTNVGAPVVRPVVTQPTPPITQTTVVTQQQAFVRPTQVQQTVPMQTQPLMQAQTVRQQTVTTQAPPKVTPLIPRVRPVPVNDIAKALSDQQRAVSQPQYVVNKQTNTVMEPTLAMHSLMNVQRKTEPVTVQKQVDGKQQIQTTQVQRTPVVVQEQSTMPLTVANTTTTKPVVAKQKLTIRDIQRAERERLAQLAAEEAAQQAGTNQVDQQMVAQKQAEAQRQAAILGEQQRQMALQAEQQRIAQQQAEAQRQAAMQAEQQRIAQQQAEAQRQAAEQERLRIQAEQQRLAAEQAEAQRQAALKAEQERIAAQQAEQQRIAAEQAEAQRQAALRAEQERIAALQAEQQRIAAEHAEAQRQAALSAEQERIAALQAEQQRISAEQAEAQRQAAMQAEQQRIAQQQAEAQRQAAMQAEQQRAAQQAALRAEQERIAAEQAEAQRQAALKAEQDRIAAQQAEQQRLAAEQAEAQRQAALKAEQERIAALQAEQQRIATEQAEAQRQAALKAEQERIAAQQAEQQRIAAEQAEAQRQAALKAEQERIAAEQAEAQRQAALKAERERILAQQAEEERLAAEEAARQRAEAAAKAEAERQAALKAEQERIAAEQAEAQRQAALKAEQERIAAQQAEQQRIAAEQAEIARQAAIKEEQERLAAEQLAKEEAEAAAKAQAEAEEKAKAEANVQESKLPQSYVDARNEASTKGSAVVEEKDILSQPMEPPLQADASSKISLAFDVKNYESMSTTVDNKEIKYRAFEYIPYVANPIDIDQQYMNIYVPEEYFNNGTVNGYNTQTAPIFMPNAVGGYMPSQAMTPKVENGKPNSVVYALSRGYVVASPATRGRTNKASDGNFIGKAPAVIVDLQAATAYLHANDSTMPGNANRIITNGTSAGGAVSLLQGAAGNSSDFQPYLQALGAATAATNVYAVSAYAPITNLDAADMAYEWSYNGITSSNKVSMNHDDVAYSNLLNEHFPDYVNNLQLHDSVGRVLKLDKNGNGTFKNYVKEFIVVAANKAQAKGTDLSKHTYLVRDNKTGTIKDINWEAYNQFVSRSKAPGAFDSRSNDSGENNLFGTSTTDNNHFTITAALHDTTSNPEAYVQNAKVVTMMNPMNYLGSPAATNAQFYRIRYGTADSNTSVAIPLIVGTRAQNLGYKVDMATPFDVNHSGDYDLDELFNWMDNIVKNGR